MSENTARKAWGTGRVAFLARLDTIRSEISQGHPLTAIFDRHRIPLGIGYRSFCRLVVKYADDPQAPPRRSTSRPVGTIPASASKPAPPVPKVTPKPSFVTAGPADVRQEPTARRGFHHDPLERPDDRALSP
jgi:hypothetical protein